MKQITALCFGLLLSSNSLSDTNFWPNGAKAAVSLAYDDALNSHLDNAIHHLNKHNFKASFYLTMSSPVVSQRLEEWRIIAKDGHELGNHTINHGCSKSLLNNPAWIQDWNNLDSRTIAEMAVEVRTANAFLTAIDGKTQRTFTAPCGQWQVSDGSYQHAIKNDFIALKAYFTNQPQPLNTIIPSNVHVTGVQEGASSQDLINFIKQAAEQGSIANLTFHGIGADQLSISNKTHKELLEYLDNHRDIYWVDTFANIMTYYKEKQSTSTEE